MLNHPAFLPKQAVLCPPRESSCEGAVFFFFFFVFLPCITSTGFCFCVHHICTFSLSDSGYFLYTHVETDSSTGSRERSRSVSREGSPVQSKHGSRKSSLEEDEYKHQNAVDGRDGQRSLTVHASEVRHRFLWCLRYDCLDLVTFDMACAVV